jgi:hypothetical protein
MGNPDVRRLKKGVSGMQGDYRALAYLKSDFSRDHPADDRTGMQVKPSLLARSELDPHHLDTFDLRPGLQRCLEQRRAHDGRRLRHRREM